MITTEIFALSSVFVILSQWLVFSENTKIQKLYWIFWVTAQVFLLHFLEFGTSENWNNEGKLFLLTYLFFTGLGLFLYQQSKLCLSSLLFQMTLLSIGFGFKQEFIPLSQSFLLLLTFIALMNRRENKFVFLLPVFYFIDALEGNSSALVISKGVGLILYFLLFILDEIKIKTPAVFKLIPIICYLPFIETHGEWKATTNVLELILIGVVFYRCCEEIWKSTKIKDFFKNKNEKVLPKIGWGVALGLWMLIFLKKTQVYLFELIGLEIPFDNDEAQQTKLLVSSVILFLAILSYFTKDKWSYELMDRGIQKLRQIFSWLSDRSNQRCTKVYQNTEGALLRLKSLFQPNKNKVLSVLDRVRTTPLSQEAVVYLCFVITFVLARVIGK